MTLPCSLEKRTSAAKREIRVTSSKAKTENHRNLNAVFFWGLLRPASPPIGLSSDEMILDLAINGRAEALVTSNTSILRVQERGLAFRCFLRWNC